MSSAHSRLSHYNCYRLSLDAAHSKAEKLRNSTKGSANNKKDRELKDAEEEYEEAKSR